MLLINGRDADRALRDSAAHALIEALAHAPSAWKTFDDASAEVASFMNDADRLSIFAVADDVVAGWIGAIRHSDFAWELHPLVVRPALQRQRIGSRLVGALEERARSANVVSIWLGTDDDFGGTNLFGRDLYPDVLAALQQLRSTTGHPFVFYEKLGYAVTGVLPDVDGVGKHDILMAKRLSGPQI